MLTRISFGNKQDFYRNNLMFWILPISLISLFYLLGAHFSSLFFSSDWFINLMVLPGFFGAQLSGVSYLGRTLDHAGKSSAGLGERIGTWVGVALGLAFGIGLSILKAVSPFAQALSVVGNFLFTLGVVGAFSGLGNRFGQFADKENNRPVNEKRAIGIAGIVGLVIGVALVATKCALAVSVVGVTTVMTGGGALPLWIAGFAFVGTFASTCASAADYVSKTISFMQFKRSTTDAIVNKTVKKRFHEYRGSLVGISTGVIMAGIIIGAIAVTQPHILAGFVGLIAATVIVMSCVSVIGGLFSRVGRMVDVYQYKGKKRREPASDTPSSSAEPTPDSTPSPPSPSSPRYVHQKLGTERFKVEEEDLSWLNDPHNPEAHRPPPDSLSLSPLNSNLPPLTTTMAPA